MVKAIMEPNFTREGYSPDEIVFTRAAKERLVREDVAKAVALHRACDWEDQSAEDQVANAYAIKLDLRLFASYRDRNDVRFWLVTDEDRAQTTVIVPDDL